jgi:hypothetical protein
MERVPRLDTEQAEPRSRLVPRLDTEQAEPRSRLRASFGWFSTLLLDHSPHLIVMLGNLVA